MKQFLEETDAHIVIVQEHHLFGERLLEQDAKLRKLGWRIVWDAATPSVGDGSRGGTAVCVRASVGVAECKLSGEEACVIGPLGDVDSGRNVSAHVWNCFRGGFKVVGGYLWTGEGLSERNIQVLDALRAQVIGVKGPWMIGADFNMGPEELEAWANSIGGVIVRSSSVTCVGKQGVGGSEIDFFIIKAELVYTVERVYVDMEAGTRPHYPVIMEIAAKPRSLMARVFAEPASFPLERPVGCVREETDWGRFHALAEVAEDQPTLDAAWKGFTETAEEEIVNLHDIVVGADKHKGRSGGTKIMRVPMVGTIGRNEPHMDPVTRAWSQVHRWLSHLRHCGPLPNGQWPTGRRIQAEALERRIRQSKKRRELDHEEWERWLMKWNLLGQDDFEAKFESFTAEFERRKRKCDSEATANWRDFAKSALAGNAAQGHRWSKARELQRLA